MKLINILSMDLPFYIPKKITNNKSIGLINILKDIKLYYNNYIKNNNFITSKNEDILNNNNSKINNNIDIHNDIDYCWDKFI